MDADEALQLARRARLRGRPTGPMPQRTTTKPRSSTSSIRYSQRSGKPCASLVDSWTLVRSGSTTCWTPACTCRCYGFGRPEARTGFWPSFTRRRKTAPDPAAWVADRLKQREWRGLLVACSLLVLGYGRREDTVESLWSQLVPYSWVAPQIAGTLSVLDPAFEERATSTLDQPDQASDKSMLSLRALLSTHPRVGEWLDRYGEASPELRFWSHSLGIGFTSCSVGPGDQALGDPPDVAAQIADPAQDSPATHSASAHRSRSDAPKRLAPCPNPPQPRGKPCLLG